MRSLKIIIVTALCVVCFSADAQIVTPMGYKDYSFYGQVNIGNHGAVITHPSAVLELKGTTKGFLYPRLTTTQRNAISSPATGLSIYNTTTNTFNYYNGTSWVDFGASVTGTPTQVAFYDPSTGSLTGNNNLLFTSTTNFKTVKLKNNNIPSSATDTMGASIGLTAYSKKTAFGTQTQRIDYFIEAVGQISGSAGGGGLRIRGRIDSTSFFRNVLTIDQNGNMTGFLNTDKSIAPYNPVAALSINNKKIGGSSAPNLFFGSHAMDTMLTAGIKNTAIGDLSLQKLRAGDENTAVGYSALANADSTTYSTAVGAFALFSNTTGYQNAAFGKNALVFNTSGIKNSAFGAGCFESNVTGSFLSAFGHDAGLHNIGGVNNTLGGWLALGLNENGGENVVMGFNTGNTIKKADNLVLIGSRVDSPEDTLINSIGIGYNAVVSQSNEIVIGNTSHTSTKVFGVAPGPGTKQVRYNPSSRELFYIDTSAAGGGSGEINTASNLGGGVANFSSKSGVDLRFNSFDANHFKLSSNLISIDTATNGQSLSTRWRNQHLIDSLAGTIISASTFQSLLDLESAKAVTNKNDTIDINSHKFVIGNFTVGPWITWHGGQDKIDVQASKINLNIADGPSGSVGLYIPNNLAHILTIAQDKVLGFQYADGRVGYLDPVSGIIVDGANGEIKVDSSWYTTRWRTQHIVDSLAGVTSGTLNFISGLTKSGSNVRLGSSDYLTTTAIVKTRSTLGQFQLSSSVSGNTDSVIFLTNPDAQGRISMVSTTPNSGAFEINETFGQISGDSAALGFGLGSSINFVMNDGHAAHLRKGIQYAGNYVGGFTNRSLVDKHYVDSIAAGLGISSSLANGKFWVGNGSGVATAVTPTGDVTFDNTGVFAIGASKVINSMVNSVAWSKITSTPTTLAGYAISDAQPLDADLTTIAALSATTDNFMVANASAWASRTPAQARTSLGLVIGTNVQAYDADLDTWSGITPGSGVGTFLATPSSANLATAVTGETGSGALVFGTSPDFTTGATIGGVAIPTISSTNTLTNKRWTARVGSTTSSATPTINSDNVDIYKLTAQTADITSFTTNLSGTPVDGDILEIQVTGTAARAITWGASFVASTVALPTTTVTTATLSVVFQYYTTSSYGNNKWVCVNSF